MTDHLCVICAKRPHDDGRTCCTPCLDRILGDLERIVELTDAAATWTPRAGAGNGVRSVPGSRPPLSVDILDAALGLDVLPLLESWQRIIREDAGLTPYGTATEGIAVNVASAVAFLRSWLLWCATEAAWPIEELAREIREARMALDRLDPDHERPDGLRVACTEPHPDADGRECGYRLVIVGAMLSQDVECRRCGHVTTGGRMILSALSDPAVTVWAYPDVIEDTLGIPTRTLRRWVRYGWVTRLGSRYDVGAAYRVRVTNAG